MARTVSRKRTPPTEQDLETALLQQYVTAGKIVSDANSTKKAARDKLLEIVQQDHEVVPEKGHRLHTLPKAISVLGQTITGFMHQRKTSQVFLDDKAEALCKKKGFDEDDYVSYERYVDQDKIARLYADDKITKKEFDRLYDTDETWAFSLVKE